MVTKTKTKPKAKPKGTGKKAANKAAKATATTKRTKKTPPAPQPPATPTPAPSSPCNPSVPQFAWKDGFRAPVSAQVAGEELDRIREEHGEVAPAVVVDESRPDEAPLHPCFEWDDPVAAELYRVEQARRVIRNVRTVSYAPENPEPVKRIIYVSLQDREHSTYQPIDDVLQDDEGRAILLRNALLTLKGWERRYGELSAEATAAVRAAMTALENS